MRSALVGVQDEVIDAAKSLSLKSASRTTFNSGGEILRTLATQVSRLELFVVRGTSTRTVAGAAAIVFIIVAFLMRDRPEDLGLYPLIITPTVHVAEG
jgi:sugar phosphate permease